jgi:outer membrane protein OmpA-like peptidoglycan-associated protein
MRYANQIARIGVAATLLFGASGCATRHYVRTQLANMQSEAGRGNTDLRAAVDRAGKAADQAGARAADAARESEAARLMALGQMGYSEVERYRVYFPYNGTAPEPDADPTLARASEVIAAHPEYLVEIYGYTDTKGSDAYNLELSRRRAESVRRALVAQAPSELSRFHTIGFGEDAPPSEAAALGEGVDRRQVVIVLVERTAPLTTTQPFTEKQDGPR